MPGRNPKIPETLDDGRTHYSKAEIEARRANTPKIESARLRPPKWLDDIARIEWRRVVRLARESGIYTDLDVNALGMYCMSYSRAIQAYKEYKELEERQSVDNPGKSVMIYKGRTNPLMSVAMAAEDQCRKWSAILGLDPVSRARMGIARKNATVEDPLEDLLNEFTNYANSGNSRRALE